ncbi:MAG: 7TM-DISM domain-containing protein [Thiolinea sp.]
MHQPGRHQQRISTPVSRRSILSRRLWLLWLCSLLLCVAVAAPTPEPLLILDEQSPPTLSLLPYLSIYRHGPATEDVTVLKQAVADGLFVDLPAAGIPAIDKHATTWLRLDLLDNNGRSRYLLVNNIGINDRQSVQLYRQILNETGGANNELQALQRLQAHVFPSFELINPPGRHVVYYLRFNNKSNYQLNIPVSLYTPEPFQQKLKQDYVFFGGILFSLVVLGLYNLALFFPCATAVICCWLF